MSMFNNNQPYMPGFGFRPQIFQQAGMPQQTPQQSTVTYVTSRAQAEVAQIPLGGRVRAVLQTPDRGGMEATSCVRSSDKAGERIVEKSSVFFNEKILLTPDR